MFTALRLGHCAIISQLQSWKLGIARPDGRGIVWGKIEFPAPEAAALHACRVVHDEGLKYQIAQAMTDNHYQHESAIKRALGRFQHGGANYDR